MVYGGFEGKRGAGVYGDTLGVIKTKWKIHTKTHIYSWSVRTGEYNNGLLGEGHFGCLSDKKSIFQSVKWSLFSPRPVGPCQRRDK